MNSEHIIKSFTSIKCAPTVNQLVQGLLNKYAIVHSLVKAAMFFVEHHYRKVIFINVPLNCGKSTEQKLSKDILLASQNVNILIFACLHRRPHSAI